MVPVALMWGETIVRDTMRNEYIGGFSQGPGDERGDPDDTVAGERGSSASRRMSLTDLPILFIDHKLKDISLNSISKWNARVKPSLMDFMKRKRCLPERIIFAFASMVVFYRGDTRDSSEVKNFFSTYVDKGHNEELLEKFLGNESFFGEDLRRIKGIKERMLRYMDEIETRGMKEALISLLEGARRWNGLG